jgi:hypothetical protein
METVALTPPGRQIVGGLFGYETSSRASRARVVPFLQRGDLLFLNARSAFDHLLGSLRPRNIWLPAFLCPTLVAVSSAHGEPRFYQPSVGRRLAGDEWLKNVGAGDVVLFTDYFGFGTPGRILAAAARRGACVIEDACQALLTDGTGKHADFVLFSPRKFLGVTDGGVLSSHRGRRLPRVVWRKTPRVWRDTMLCAARGRAVFDRGGENRDWFELFQRAEATAPIGPFRMTTLSQKALWTQFEYAEISRRRRENYRLLATQLPELALFRRLPTGTVPMGFPAVFGNRDTVRGQLFAEEIYPPIHWPIAGFVPKSFVDSHRLSEQILTLPCDQRYELATMERLASIVKGFARPCRDI